MKKLTARQNRVLAYLNANRKWLPMSIPEITSGMGETATGIRTAIKRLEGYGAVRPRGTSQTGARCYDLPEED